MWGILVLALRVTLRGRMLFISSSACFLTGLIAFATLKFEQFGRGFYYGGVDDLAELVRRSSDSLFSLALAGVGGCVLIVLMALCVALWPAAPDSELKS